MVINIKRVTEINTVSLVSRCVMFEYICTYLLFTLILFAGQYLQHHVYVKEQHHVYVKENSRNYPVQL